MQNLFFLGGNNGNGQQFPNQSGNDESFMSTLNESQNQSLQGLQSSSLLSQFPLISQQQQAVVAAQAAAAMAERSLNMAASPSSSFGVTQQVGGFDLADNAGGASTAHQLQMGSGLMSGYNSSFEGSGMSGFMDTNRLLLQRLQAAQQNSSNVAAASPWASFGAGAGFNSTTMAHQATGIPSAPAALSHDIYAESGLLGPWSTTSAGLLGKIASLESAAKKKVVRKKPKDKPKRPLSAYNIFFKEERARILAAIPSGGEADGADKSDEGGEKGSKKKKKVPHGKIGFESLAKVIGQRWQELEPEKAEYYKAKAAEDMKRYKDEMEVFLTKQAEKKRAAESKREEQQDREEEGSEKRKSPEEATGESPHEAGNAPANKKRKVEEGYGSDEELLG